MFIFIRHYINRLHLIYNQLNKIIHIHGEVHWRKRLYMNEINFTLQLLLYEWAYLIKVEFL